MTTLSFAQVAALPWRIDSDGELRLMLITSRQNAKWMIPKGHPMDGRADWQAARLEALEEAGVEGEVSQTPLGAYHFLRLAEDRPATPALASVYALRVETEHRRWKEMKQRRRKWFRPQQAAEAIYEPDLARLIARVADGSISLG